MRIAWEKNIEFLEVPSNIHLALVHAPVYNKSREIVTSSVTTLDVHDISRICKTYAVDSFYVVTPLKTQQRLVERIVEHWVKGYGAEYNPTRKQALLSVRVQNYLRDVVRDISERFGETPRTVITDAKKLPQSVDYQGMREEIARGGHILLVFGTGWGLEKSLLDNADFILNPIDGLNGYNHLPVRAAIAIILDRLLAPRSF